MGNKKVDGRHSGIVDRSFPPISRDLPIAMSLDRGDKSGLPQKHGRHSEICVASSSNGNVKAEPLLVQGNRGASDQATSTELAELMQRA